MVNGDRKIKIQICMLAHRVTGADIARLTGFSRSYVSHVIGGRMRCQIIEDAVAKSVFKAWSDLWAE